MVDLLKSNVSGRRKNAAKALRNLALNDENQKKIAEAGGIPLLVGLLNDELSNIRKRAVAVLVTLSVNDENKQKIVEAGGIIILVNTITNTKIPNNIKSESAVILFRLASNKNNAKIIAREILKKKRLTQLEKSKSAIISQLATHLLELISREWLEQSQSHKK